MPKEMHVCIFDVEHGACAMLATVHNGQIGRLAMVDSGDASDWSPSDHIKNQFGRSVVDYLFITNADQALRIY